MLSPLTSLPPPAPCSVSYISEKLEKVAWTYQPPAEEGERQAYCKKLKDERKTRDLVVTDDDLCPQTV
jgi:hypothetical protein